MQRVLIKKIVKPFSVFAFAMMLFSFFACSDLPSGSGGGRNSPAVVVQPDEPYDETIGFGLYSTYVFHNFIGKEPDIIPSTAITDVNRYYDLGVTYIQGKFDAFNQTLVDRSNLQRYFTQFLLRRVVFLLFTTIILI